LLSLFLSLELEGHLKKYIILFLLFITTGVFSQSPCPGTPTVTYGGRTYNTVQIGTQCWLKENLNIGTMIKSGAQTKNGIIEKYCYDNNEDNCIKYGGLYQWQEAVNYTVSDQNVQGICPSGWHIPTLQEFQTLVAQVNNDGDALKAIGVGEGAGAGTNTSGFSALLSGTVGTDNHSSHQLVYAYFWTSTSYNPDFSYILSVGFDYKDINLYANGTGAGFCVRCIKGDGVTSVGSVEEKNSLIAGYSLSQNYPNPFNPSTVISYQLPVSGYVSLKVYDILGREVATLVNEFKQPGVYNSQFAILNFQLSSGLYFYTLRAGDFIQSKKMVMIK
jgi:uncharacterized protein (TIGR02145 family)